MQLPNLLKTASGPDDLKILATNLTLRVTVMPNQPKTRARGVRVPDELWEAAKARAEQRGETVTDVILRALRRYVRSG